MSVSLSPYAGAGAQFFDDNGVPLSGGLLYTYAAGTTTPVPTYTSQSGLVLNANPIVLNSAGRTPAQIWLTAGNSYKFVLQTSTGVTIRTDDDIFASFALADEVGVAVGFGLGGITTNIAVGNTALDSNTTGSNNTAVGSNALTANTDGFQNTAVGSEALDANTTGDYNTAVGFQAATAATTANYAVAVGYRALNAATGDGNTAVGADALLLVSTGTNNVAIGYQAGNSITTGANNIVIGFDADASSATASNEITIGNSTHIVTRGPGATLVASLPSAATVGVGARAMVTNASATTFHSIVAGGGSNIVPVFSDGTNWRIG